jgi:hypothetical protein
MSRWLRLDTPRRCPSFTEAAHGTPDPGWDFEPDTVKIKEGTTFAVGKSIDITPVVGRA